MSETTAISSNPDQASNTAGHGQADADRRALRVPYHAEGLQLKLIDKKGPARALEASGLNLSRGGVAVLVRQFVHSGEECTITMIPLNGSARELSGRVRGCRHVEGVFHEVAVILDDPVAMPEYVTLVGEERMLYAREVRKLAGSDLEAKPMTAKILLVSDSIEEAKLIKLWLRSEHIEVISACETAVAVCALQENRFDAAILDLCQADAPEDLISNLREHGLPRKLIGVHTDEKPNDDPDGWATQLGCRGVLLRPIDKPGLHKVLAQVMPYHFEQDRRPIISEVIDDPGMLPLVSEYLDETDLLVTEIEMALNAEEAASLRRLLLMVKGSARNYGFPSIGNAALELINAIDQGGSIGDEQLIDQIIELTGLLRNACRSGGHQ
ncbi:MAG: Hpt domain-containing protein [Planctomycetota bacterium]